MTVKELINQLATAPLDAKVCTEQEREVVWSSWTTGTECVKLELAKVSWLEGTGSVELEFIDE